ncbi:hypothetical protein Aperf_G00000003294 [Anoplocephala perfoliata]
MLQTWTPEQCILFALVYYLWQVLHHRPRLFHQLLLYLQIRLSSLYSFAAFKRPLALPKLTREATSSALPRFIHDPPLNTLSKEVSSKPRSLNSECDEGLNAVPLSKPTIHHASATSSHFNEEMKSKEKTNEHNGSDTRQDENQAISDERDDSNDKIGGTSYELKGDEVEVFPDSREFYFFTMKACQRWQKEIALWMKYLWIHCVMDGAPI